MSMESERSNRISTSINQMLSSLSNTKPNEQCIFKVHDRLRSNNKEAYEPKFLSIGPCHHGKSNLEKMEMHKLRDMQELLDRRDETSPDKYIIALMDLEEQARGCYAEDIRGISTDDFVKMMFLDGCFVIEFLRKYSNSELRNSDDTVFQMDWLLDWIKIDLILFENQIPFFILKKLFDMTRLSDQPNNLVDLALPLSNCLTSNHSSISSLEIIHLLDLVHKSLCSPFAERLAQINVNDISEMQMEFIKSTSELQQSGIHFEAADASQNQSWLDITFKDGKIKIPNLEIMDWTESVFRNLIAYEQYMLDGQSWRCVSAYAMFLDLLIDSPRDVEKLRHRQIISNWLGDDEAVATMFNKLGNDVMIDERKFCYSKVFENVNDFSKKRRNIWRANLMRDYFNTPWSIISFLAALVLLILTVVQTIFSILQYTNQ